MEKPLFFIWLDINCGKMEIRKVLAELFFGFILLHHAARKPPLRRQASMLFHFKGIHKYLTTQNYLVETDGKEPSWSGGHGLSDLSSDDDFFLFIFCYHIQSKKET